MPRLLPKKRSLRFLLALVLILPAAWVAVPRIVAPKIEAKLQAMIASQLDARLEIDGISYAPPYGVRVRGVSLIAEDPKHGRVEVLKIGTLDLKLAKLPVGNGPLVIENISLRNPAVHLVFADGALVGRGHLVRADGRPPKFPGDWLSSDTKLSDMFLLRHFGLSGGQVVVEDRDHPGSPPLVWKALDVDVQTAPRSKSAYDFDLATDPGAPAEMVISGAFDLDAFWLELKKLQISVDANTAAEAALPAQVQEVLKQYRIAGKIKFDGSGMLRLRDPWRSEFAASLTLTDGSGFVPKRDAALDKVAARLTFARTPQAPGATVGPEDPTSVRLESLEAQSGGSRLTVTGPSVILNLRQRAWSVSDLTAVLQLDDQAPIAPGTSPPESATTRPSLFRPLGGSGRVALSLATVTGKFGASPDAGGVDVHGASGELRVEELTVPIPGSATPLTHLTAKVEKQTGSEAVVLSRGWGTYGNDLLRVDHARVALPRNPLELLDRLRVEEISGSAEARPPRAQYPGAFGRIVAKLSPGGEFHVGGGSWFEVLKPLPSAIPDAQPSTAPDTTQPTSRAKRRLGYFISVSADRARFDFLDGRLPFTDVKGDATITKYGVNVEHFEGATMNGTAAGKYHFVRGAPGEPGKYSGEASLRGVNLKHLAESFELQPQHREKLEGNGFLNITFSGDLPKAPASWTDSFLADGEFEVIGGSFWRLPVLGDIAAGAKQADKLTLGEAAGRFEIKDRVVKLPTAAVQSPALGLFGSGTIGFDKSLDLRVTAAPLGDWKDRVKQGRIPIISDVAAEVVGGVQQILKLATTTLLFDFRVKGNLSKPKVETIPAPILTEPAALLFGTMLKEGEGKTRKWSEMARKKS